MISQHPSVKLRSKHFSAQERIRHDRPGLPVDPQGLQNDGCAPHPQARTVLSVDDEVLTFESGQP